MNKARFSKNFKTKKAYEKWNKAHKEFNIPYSTNANISDNLAESDSVSLETCTPQEINSIAGYIVRNLERKREHDIWLNGGFGNGGEE